MKKFAWAAAIFALAGLFIQTPASLAQERDLPEEVRALAAVCAAGTTNVTFRGEIEGGLNRLFGRMLSGTGDLDFSESGNEFINSFQDEQLKLEARRIVSDCVIRAMEIIYNFSKEDRLTNTSSSILVPDALSRVSAGQQFALKAGQSIMLESGAIFSVSSVYAQKPVGSFTHKGRERTNRLDIGETISSQDDPCSVVYYTKREIAEKEFVYSFIYQC